MSDQLDGLGTGLAPLFGLPVYLEGERAADLWQFLSEHWINQLRSAPKGGRLFVDAEARLNAGSSSALQMDLDLMSLWFDPIASGKRLRDVISALGTLDGVAPRAAAQLCYEVGPGKVLVTPEGRAVLWLLARRGLGDAPTLLHGVVESVLISFDELEEARSLVSAQYRRWAMQRLSSVSSLLVRETATLRPTAAGLLLVLLLNRNTSWSRRLPAPSDHEASATVSRAITSPALAFAQALTGTESARPHGLDLYRGWALGELTRRLGTAIHREDQGIWIDEASVITARARLAESLASRSRDVRQKVPAALEAALAEYERRRPELSGLGVAFERPDATTDLISILRAAASGDLGATGGDGGE